MSRITVADGASIEIITEGVLRIYCDAGTSVIERNNYPVTYAFLMDLCVDHFELESEDE